MVKRKSTPHKSPAKKKEFAVVDIASPSPKKAGVEEQSTNCKPSTSAMADVQEEIKEEHPPKIVPSQITSIRTKLNDIQIKNLQHNLLRDALDDRRRLLVERQQLRATLATVFDSMKKCRRLIGNDLRKLHEDQDALCVEFDFQFHEMQKAVHNHDGALVKERDRMRRAHEWDEQRMRDVKANAECCRTATKQMKSEATVDALRCSALERDLAACQQKLTDKAFMASHTSCTKCIPTEVMRATLAERVAVMTRERKNIEAEAEKTKKELKKKARIIEMMSKSTERAVFEAKSAKDHMQAEIALAVKRREEELMSTMGASPLARRMSSDPRLGGGATIMQPNPSPPISDTSPCSSGTPRESGDPSKSSKNLPSPPTPPIIIERKDACTSPKTDARLSVEDGEEVDAVLTVEENLPLALAHLHGYQTICAHHRSENKKLIDEVNLFAGRTEEGLDDIEELHGKLELSTARATAAEDALAKSKVECEEMRRHLAMLTDGVKAYIGQNGAEL